MTTKTEEERIDFKNSEKGAWLIKFPKNLSDVWSQSAPNQDLGYITHNKITGEISLMLKGEGTIPVPKIYNVTRYDVANQPHLSIFTESKGKVTIEGKVECKGELTPVNGLSDDYRRIVKSRTTKSNTKLRQTIVTGIDAHVIKPQKRPLETINAIFPLVKRNDRGKDKRVRGTKEFVLDRLFAAFEKKQFWDLPSLVIITDQPQAYLKEILEEVCVKNTSGPNRFMYELKEQYKTLK